MGSWGFIYAITNINDLVRLLHSFINLDCEAKKAYLGVIYFYKRNTDRALELNKLNK